MASAQIPAVITYHKPGTQPPLYVAGTFSDPQWKPYEMEHTKREDGEYDFKKEIRAEPGSKIQYKFRLGDGDWWVLKDDGPTVTDSAGNTNHVLEVKPQEEPSPQQVSESQPRDAGDNAPLSYAKAAAKNIQPSIGEAATDRSGTGTPIFARVAAEVADSAELLHEEVPDREKPEGVSASSETGTKAGSPSAGERTGAAEPIERRESTIVILEPPPGEAGSFRAQPQVNRDIGEQDDFIADKSPLFAHECVGLFESDEEIGLEDVAEAHERSGSRVEDIDPNQVDLNDPTLERFPSNRDDIMATVRKLETGLPADEADFDGNARSPVINPSRRGTEDITGDFHLSAPQPTPPPTRRSSKKSPRGSVGSVLATASLHSISEAEEPVVEEEEEEEEASFRPAVVFTNPLKPRPKHLKLPSSEEDEGVALPDGVSPRTVKPSHRIATPEASPTHSARSGSDPARNLVSAEVELDKDKERSMQEVYIHPAPRVGDQGPSQADPPKSAAKETDHPAGRSHAQVASSEPNPGEEPRENKPSETKPISSQTPSAEGPAESKDTASHAPRARRLSYAEVAASKPPPAEEPSTSKTPTTTTTSQPPSTAGSSESKDKAQQSQQSQPQQQGASSRPRRMSYAEVAASKPPAPPSEDKPAAKQPSASGASAASSTSTARPAAEDLDQDKSTTQLRKRAAGAGGGGEQQQPQSQSQSQQDERVRSPDSAGAAAAAAASGGGILSVQLKKGAGWIRAVFRFVFVDLIGRIFRRVLRLFRIGGRREA